MGPDATAGAAVGGCGDGLDDTEVVSGVVGLGKTGEEVVCADAMDVSVAAAVGAAVVSTGITVDCSGATDGVQADKVTAREYATEVVMHAL